MISIFRDEALEATLVELGQEFRPHVEAQSMSTLEHVFYTCHKMKFSMYPSIICNELRACLTFPWFFNYARMAYINTEEDIHWRNKYLRGPDAT